jgi:two-component system chemotaxis response regulator CheY
VRPDLVTLDLNMPVMNGREALKEILVLDPTAKVIVVTAMNQPLLRKDLMEAGAKEVLGKPIRLESLLNTIRDVLMLPSGNIAGR